MKANPLLEGFRLGIQGITPAQFDTIAESESETMTADTDIPALAARWRCSEMTIRRMIGRGIDPTDAAAVAVYLLALKNPAEPVLEAILDELEIYHEDT